MKLRNKLLTALLPITATSALVPVLTSCNKGTSWDFGYGDELNCLDTAGKNYHSLNDIKNAVKNHTVIETQSSITLAQMSNITATEQGKQFAFFDLVASLAILNEFKFILKYDSSTKLFNLKYVDKEGASHETQTNGVITYVPHGQITEPQQIDVTVGSLSEFQFKSYCFQNTKVTAE